VLFIVINNQEYRTLKQTITARGGAAARTGSSPGMDLNDPAIDWPQLALSLGVASCRVEHAGDLAEIVRTAGGLAAPLLVDVPVRRFVP
jgi:benzoylformate decarboxylase